MTRAARMSTLLIAFSLLTSAAAAHAECAWVLWGRDEVGTWVPRTALSTEARCRQEHTKMSDNSYRSVVELRRPELARQAYFECWPDTVDPRGPKGK